MTPISTLLAQAKEQVALETGWKLPLLPESDWWFSDPKLNTRAALLALSNQREEYEKGWISVKDRLPDKPMLLVVFCPSYTNYEEPIMAKWVEGKNGMMFYDYDEWQDMDITNDVTHWMPLPSPPLNTKEK